MTDLYTITTLQHLTPQRLIKEKRKEFYVHDIAFQLTSAEEFVNKTKKDEKKEDWNSRQWNQDCYKEPYKRK